MLYYIGNLKTKECLVIICASVGLLMLFYYASTPEDLSHISRKEFLKSRREHRGRQITDNAVHNLINTDRIYFKETLLRPMLIERVSGTEGNRMVQKHIKNLMSGLGWTIQEDPFTDNTPYGEKEFNNIIATQDPNAPRKLTLACHFDSKYYANFEFIGATDSAVPCSMLIDLATALNHSLWSSNKNQQLSLQLLFLDGEEAFVRWSPTDSIYGARHLANKMDGSKREVLREVIVSELEVMDMFMLLDLIGTANPTFHNFFSSTSNQFQQLRNTELRLSQMGVLSFGEKHSNTYFPSANVRYSGIEDDHIPFLRKNVPILHMIASPFPHVWHKESDNESALDYDTIDDLNKILRVFVAEYLHLKP